MCPVPWHPQCPNLDQNNRLIMNFKSRTDVGGVRYLFTDFGLSSKGEGKTVGLYGIEPAPELSRRIPYDPYRLDVYILGRQYQILFVDVSVGLLPVFPTPPDEPRAWRQNFVNVEFLRPLIDRMTARDPNSRPSASEAYTLFFEIRARLNLGRFSQRLRTKDEGGVARTIEESRYWLHRQWARLGTQPALTPFQP